MEMFMAGLEPGVFLAAAAITFLAGFVKGAVGFAMPLILVSGFAMILPKELALAGLILPTVLTNVSQALRQGIGPARATGYAYRRFMVATVICIGISAPFIEIIPRMVYLLLLGVPLTIYAGLQVLGKSLAIQLHHRDRAEWLLGAIGGLLGGISGIWGPPLVVFQLSIGAEKREAIRAQGVVFLIAAVMLLASHLATGVANAQSLGFSAALCLPAMAGLHLGFMLQDRMDQRRFRLWTQALLVLTGLNMVRLALV